MACEKPNILMIVADQHRWDCVGAAGRYPARTPHLDQLAADGAFFEQASTPIPVCGPARQALLSGLAPDSYGGLWNLDFLDCPALLPSERFYMAALKRSGYHSTLIGKWNVSRRHTPQDFGFNRHIDLNDEFARAAGKYPDLVWPNSWFGDPSPVALADSKTHLAARVACEQMEADAKSGSPWLIRVDFQDPHLPCRPSEPFASMHRPEDMVPWDSFADSLANKPYIQHQQRVNWQLQDRTWQDWSRTVALYFGMVSQIDDAVGRMLERLADLGLAENTIVLYTSDHGDLCGGHGLIDKHYVLYDDVIRVPLIVRDPRRSRKNLRIRSFVSHLDLGATIAGLCGLTGVDPGHGRSIESMLDGQEQPERDQAVCSANGQQFGFFAQRCIRTQDWLYVWNLTDIDELYDLRRDPGQLENRICDPDLIPDLTALRQRLYNTLKARSDPFVRTDWVRDQLMNNRKLI
jgi:arylsulfatase A-like enzyme